jgi:hypothetical protein
MQYDRFISPFIANQFPDLYREEGPSFIAFVKAYYEWLEQEGGVWSEGKRLLEYRDIDTTLDKFIESFRAKYLVGVPPDVLGDPRTLQKHIKEIYASKGTSQGLKLLFRLLYNTDVEVYYPGDDVFKLSDGKWRRPTYLEISYTPFNSLLIGQRVFMQPENEGDEPVEAFVESLEVKYREGRRLDVLVVTNVRGTFKADRLLFSDVLSAENSPIIKGSLTSIFNIGTGFNYQVGDVLDVIGQYGYSGHAVVTKVSRRDGTVFFSIIDGGSGYTLEYSNIILNNPTSNGVGAEAEVSAISNTETFTTAVDSIQTQITANTTITQFFNGLTIEEPILDRTLNDVLDVRTLTMGTISRLRIVAAGQGYTGQVSAEARDDIIGGHNLPDGRGGIKGLNAELGARSGTGGGAVDEVIVVDSGFGYRDLENLTLRVADLSREQSNSNPNGITNEIDGVANVFSQGIGSGFWVGNDGFASDGKYLHDSYYFQEYSYEIQSKLPFSRYADVLRTLWHPAGAEPFGRPVIIDSVPVELADGEEAYQEIEVELEDGVAPIEGESFLAIDTEVEGVIISLLP